VRQSMRMESERFVVYASEFSWQSNLPPI